MGKFASSRQQMFLQWALEIMIDCIRKMINTTIFKPKVIPPNNKVAEETYSLYYYLNNSNILNMLNKNRDTISIKKTYIQLK